MQIAQTGHTDVASLMMTRGQLSRQSGASAKAGGSSPSGAPYPSDLTAKDVPTSDLRELLCYLERTRAKAETVKENSPAGSYLDGALARTIAGLDEEIGELQKMLSRN